MGHSQADKAQNRERILNEAARQIRQGGLENLSVGPLMESVNLTHGGFYGHFASRSELIAQALERALCEGEAKSRASDDPDKLPSATVMVRSYLSRTHRDAPDTGCAIAALISDVGRADARCRAVMQPHIETFIARAARVLGSGSENEAILAVSAMVGALAISRVITDPKRSDAILRAVRDAVIAMNAND
ncbi:TetR/AcrR family transcriptional regulator [Bradyrhizobium sp. Tv2a-2]|uniref:TetR/AcrR family transcriptional regulator n=1 Tax=Bradyrhizobium sp. Tv2a-2 TaxID=113395 RepID=UPI000415EFC2|nr:TetR/AcrR family transcriptional regulator [Bradyrhizobium sp. Tv2a-2]